MDPEGSVEFVSIPQIQRYFQDNVMAGEWWRRASATFWNQEFWLPVGVTWDDIHTSIGDIIFIPLLIGVLFLVVRDFVVEPFLLLPIARKVQIPNRRRTIPEPNETLERLFQRYETTPPEEALAEASKTTHLTDRQVERWLRRRYAVNRLNRYEKFLNCGFKLVCHICFGVLGASVTLSKSFFWDTTLCWKDYPNHPVSSDVYWYYMILLGYYWAITFDELPRPGGKGFDKAQMILHHTLTILLIVFSWTTGYVRIGSLILFVHEYSDIALLAAKVFHYAGNDAPTEPLFKAFLVLWGVTRCGILPFWIVRSVFLEAKPAGVDMPALYMMQSWFVGLLCLTAIWTGLIVRTVGRKLRGGGLRDARSATEESESEESKKTQ